jgi:diguanylate cyclase (GGDEF)-like protein
VRGELLRAITTSIGVAGFPEHGQTVAALLRAADVALYEAKHAGRNRVVVAKPA